MVKSRNKTAKSFGGVILSPSCENRCLFCGIAPRVSDRELRRQEVNVFKNLKEFIQKGIEGIEISGCDPIEYENITALIKYAKKDLKFPFVQLSTHGNKLFEKDFLINLIDSKIDKLKIPIYGSRAQIHDSITQNKGSFKKVIEGIKKLKKMAPKIDIQICSLIMKNNKDDLIDLVKLIRKLNITDYYFAVPCVPRDDFSFYLPFKQLPPYIKKLWNYISAIKIKPSFFEIPYCVFGQASPLVNNTLLPPDLGKNCQPKKNMQSGIKDLPKYRVKIKTEICKKCKCSSFCDGFFQNDVKKFGTGKLKPIQTL